MPPICLSREDKNNLFHVEDDFEYSITQIKERDPASVIPEFKGSRLSKRIAQKSWITLWLCERQEWHCFWCGHVMEKYNTKAPLYRTLEHVHPQSIKGRLVNRLDNLRAACTGCNKTRSIWTQYAYLARKLNETKLELYEKKLEIEILKHQIGLRTKKKNFIIDFLKKLFSF